VEKIRGKIKVPTYLVPLLIITSVGSAPFISKNLPIPSLFILLYTIALAIGLTWLVQTKQPLINRCLSSYFSLSLLLGTFVLGVLVFYPQSRTVPKPSTGPDAMIVPSMNLFQGTYFYQERLFDGAAISPGPGWILLNSLISGTGLQPLLTPCYLTVAALIVGKATSSHRGAVLLLLISFACLNFLQQSVCAHDMFAMGCAMLIITLVTFQQRKNEIWICSLAVAAGVVATARVPLVIFPLILGVFLSRLSIPHAVRFTAIALSTALLLHGTVFCWGQMVGGEYQPFHVFNRARHGTGMKLLTIGALLSAIFAMVSVWKVREKASSWLFWAWVTIFIPFCTVGIGELIHYERWVFANWEGNNYLTFSLPLLIGAFILAEAERGNSVRAGLPPPAS
jgi:hypothetical protein